MSIGTVVTGVCMLALAVLLRPLDLDVDIEWRWWLLSLLGLMSIGGTGLFLVAVGITGEW